MDEGELVLHHIYEHIDQFYNFKGLHTFKEKFNREWFSRYLVYPGPVSLPRTNRLNPGQYRIGICRID
jgi:phosphatidylglycerol lysyltransferase